MNQTLRNALLRGACTVSALIFAAFLLSSGDKRHLTPITASAGDRDTVFGASASNLLGTALTDIYNLPKVYILEQNNDPTPRPAEEGFEKLEDPQRQNYDGSPIDHYQDSTIDVKCWKEKHDGTVFNFAEVTIAHPSQFRRKLVDDVISKNHLDYPSRIFRQMNGVVGMSADYCAYRSYGITVQYGHTVREIPNGSIDILLYDNDGNFTCMRDKDYAKSEFAGGRNVMYSFSFGPTLVDDYKLNESGRLDNYIIARVEKPEPRAAIGQFGYEKRYLLCTAEQSGKNGPGASVRRMAEIMQEKGVRVAYNMDGGQTAALMYHGDLFSKAAYGGQRPVSDILFFATAIPEN